MLHKLTESVSYIHAGSNPGLQVTQSSAVENLPPQMGVLDEPPVQGCTARSGKLTGAVVKL